MKWTIMYSALAVCFFLPPALLAQSTDSTTGNGTQTNQTPDSTSGSATQPAQTQDSTQPAQTQDSTDNGSQPAQTQDSTSGGAAAQNPPPPDTNDGGAQPASSGHSGYHMNHVELGAFADYFRFAPSGSNATTNFLGAGARLAFSVQPHLALEAEGNYDFAQNYTSTYSTTSGTVTTTTTTTSSIRPITAIFGPKFQLGTSGPVRAFITGKIGFIDWSTSSSSSVTGSQVSSAISGIGNSSPYFVAYPGAGIEFFGGPVGIRLEAGDEIYLNNGAYNNLRVTIGPTFRF